MTASLRTLYFLLHQQTGRSMRCCDRINFFHPRFKCLHSLPLRKFSAPSTQEEAEKICDSMAAHFQIKRLRDWYRITSKEFLSSTFSPQTSLSLFELLCFAYPQLQPSPWAFSALPRNFWSEKKNQRSFMDGYFRNSERFRTFSSLVNVKVAFFIAHHYF